MAQPIGGNQNFTRVENQPGQLVVLAANQAKISGNAFIGGKINQLTLPDVATNLVGTDNTQTLSKKTFGDSITVGADSNIKNSQVVIQHPIDNDNDTSFASFYVGASQVGDIRQKAGSLVSYETSSDHRLKTNVEDINCLEIVNKLKVKKFNFKTDLDLDFVGFIAHEVKEAHPLLGSLVSGEKDEMGNYDTKEKCWTTDIKDQSSCVPRYQSMSYGNVTPFNTRAIQELHVLVQSQQELINEMKLTLDKLNNSSTFEAFKA